MINGRTEADLIVWLASLEYINSTLSQPVHYLPRTYTMTNSLNRGDIIEHEGVRYQVWEVTGEYYGLLPECELDDLDDEKSPFYVPNSLDYQVIRRHRVDPIHNVPGTATFLVETCPTTEYDLSTMRLWTDGTKGHIELQHIRMTGVLGSSDGSFSQRGRVNHGQIASIESELKRIGFWEMNINSNRPEISESLWTLRATDGVRTHSVERFGDNNEIRKICEQCYDLVDPSKLESGPFNIA